jgi:hypothetical protein
MVEITSVEIFLLFCGPLSTKRRKAGVTLLSLTTKESKTKKITPIMTKVFLRVMKFSYRDNDTQKTWGP